MLSLGGSTLNKNDEYIVTKLKEYFPDGIISKLTSYKDIYPAILLAAKQAGIRVSEYVEKLGFRYVRRESENLTDDEIKELLLESFPNGIVINLSKSNPELYRIVRECAKRSGVKVPEYIEQLGLLMQSKRNHSKVVSSYDFQTMNILLDEYEIKEAEIAQILGCTRQNINSKKGESSDNGTWLLNLTSEEERVVCEHISMLQEEFIGKEFSFALIKPKKNSMGKALIVRNGVSVKVVFSLPKTIIEALDKTDLDIFSEDELRIRDKLEKMWREQGAIESNGKKIIELNASLKTKIRNLAAKQNMDLAEYLGLYDYVCCDKRFISQEKVLEKIRKYADENNVIHLQSDDEDYHFFTSRAFRNHQNIYEFFESYGYHYTRGHYMGDTAGKHRSLIRERYLIDSNRIYISSYDPYYGTLASFALMHGKKLDQILHEWGYERISHVRELPLGYKPYDYLKELNATEKMNDDKLATALSIISNENGEVYLDVSSYLYYILFLKAKILGTSINDVLGRFGYKRTGVEQDQDTMQRYEEVEIILQGNMQQIISEKLKELEQIQSKYKTKLSKQEITERNKLLVEKLKELYQGKCQLCDPQASIPLICKENGELYSEVHHVVSMHMAESDKDIEYIDSYKNTIVLCPHHHKYVHYHHGGFRKIVLDDDVLYLENEIGERIRIHTDYHLKDGEGDGQ